MIIYKDIFSGDEMVSDSFDVTEVDDVVLEVATKVIQVGGDGEIEGVEGGDDVDDQTESVNNLVHAHRLMETQFGKKDFTIWVKGYMKQVKDHLDKTNPDRTRPFMKAASGCVKKILSQFDEYQFYTGESVNSHWF